MTSENTSATKPAKSRNEANIRLIKSREESRDGNEVWEVRLYVGKGEDGRHTYVSRTVRGGKRLARGVRAELQTQIANGTYRTRKQASDEAAAQKAQEIERSSIVVTVADLLEKWLADIDKPSAARTTYRRHCQIVRNDLIPNLGHMGLDEIEPLHIQNYYTEARKFGRKDGKGGLSERTILHHHRLLKQVLKQGVAWKMLVHNPCVGVKTPTPGKADMKILTAKELVELKKFCRNSKYYVPILLGAMTGMRRGEICGLQWDQVDFDNSTITVLCSLDEDGRLLELKEPKNHSSKRTIEIDAKTMEILRAHKLEQDKFWHEVEAVPPMRLVCADKDGHFIRPKNLSTAFREIIRKSGLPIIRFHDLRHTHASLLIHAKVSIVSISSRLGHSNVTTTLNTYGHKIPHSGREIAIAFEKLLDNAS